MRLLAATLFLLAAPGLQAKTHHWNPAVGRSAPTTGEVALSVQPGDLVDTETPWGPGGETGKDATWAAGPIRIEGAEAGDTLVVDVLKARLNRDTATSSPSPSPSPSVGAGGALRARHLWRIDRLRMTATLDEPGPGLHSLVLPLDPMLGSLAVAPAVADPISDPSLGLHASPSEVGDVREGTTVYLPVFQRGALFYFGDGLARRGADGQALATSLEVAFRFRLKKGVSTHWPRLEDAKSLTSVASARSLPDASRVASQDLRDWLVKGYGLPRPEAELLVSLVGGLQVAAAGPRFRAVVRFPKSALPVRGAEAQGLRLGDLPWTEAEPLLTGDRVVVLPLGAGSKEHGPHLLLKNDAILADYLASRIAAARPVAVLPTLAYGFYPAFLEYPGSVSLSFETQRDVVAEICRSLARYGPRRFYVLNTGVSTVRPLKATAEILDREGILLRFTDLAVAGKAAEDSVREEAYGTHADEIETSMLLYMEPGAVRMERAAADGSRPGKGPLTRNPTLADGLYSPSGVFGDPTLATWQKGEVVTEGLVQDIVREIDAMSQAPLPSGTPRSPLGAAGP